MREKRLRKAAVRGEKTLGIIEELLVGALAGVFSRFFTTPMNNLVTRKQTSGQVSGDGKPASSTQIIKDIYNEKGITGILTLSYAMLITGFWSGYRSSILLTLNPSISYYLFELFKSSFPPNTLSIGRSTTKRRTHSPLETFLFAAISKSIASAITYPFILAKARMQVSGRRNLNPFIVLARIIREEGWQGMYDGLAGQIVKGFWAQGFLLMFKERVGSLIVYLYLILHRYRARGGDISSLIEQGKQGAINYAQEARKNIPESVANASTSARAILSPAVEEAKNVLRDPAKSAEEVVEKVSDTIVGAAKSARDALKMGDVTGNAEKVAKDAIETAKGEVKGAIEQAKKK